MRRRKILILASTFPRWKNDTTPSFVFELEKKIARNFEVHVLAPHYVNAKKFELFNGIKIYRFQYFWPAKFQKLCYEGGILPNLKKNKLLIIQTLTLVICELLEAIKIIRKEKIELIHAFWIFPQGFVGMIIKCLLGTKYIVTSLGGDMFPYKRRSKFFLFLYKKIINNAETVTSVNKLFVGELDRTNNKSAYYIPNGVDVTKFKPMLKVKKSRNILFVGRLAEKKGAKYLIEAMKKLDSKKYNKLLMVGEGPLKDVLKKMIKDLSLEKKIFLKGKVTFRELLKLYNESMFLVVPSITTNDGDREGFPTVYLEAMASGCPIITSKIDGIENIIKNNDNGSVVEQKDPLALAKAMNDLICNNKLRKSIIKKALIEVRNKYSWNIVSEQYIKLIRNI